MTLQLEIFYKHKPAVTVPEYSEIELRLSNSTATSLSHIEIFLQNNRIRLIPDLAPGASYAFTYNVRDYVGEISFAAHCKEQKSICALTVVPQKLTLAEMLYIKFERLPTLLTRLDAPNGLRLRYADPPHQAFFDFYSADYTAERLLHFSRHFLEQGLIERILERLDYVTPAHSENGTGVIRGAVQWQTTLREWFNRPALANLYHEWANAPKSFITLPNLLLVRFNQELADQFSQLVRYVRQGAPASDKLKAVLPTLEQRIYQHQEALDSIYLKPCQAVAQTLSLEELDIPAQTFLNIANPAYQRLGDLWQQYLSRYVRLPEHDETVAFSGLQPMSKIFEVWAVCEIAASLELRYLAIPNSANSLLDSADFTGTWQGQPLKLYYNQGSHSGWYSATRVGVPRPDIRLEWGDKQLLLDVKYRTDQSERHERATTADVYKMLAYMNDLGITRGGIIYPGNLAGHLTTDNKGQQLVEIALRPPSALPLDFSQNLRNIIRQAFLEN